MILSFLARYLDKWLNPEQPTSGFVPEQGHSFTSRLVHTSSCFQLFATNRVLYFTNNKYPDGKLNTISKLESNLSHRSLLLQGINLGKGFQTWRSPPYWQYIVTEASLL